MAKIEKRNIYKETMQLAKEQNIGMKWYQFIIYLPLLIGAILNIFMSLSFITGTRYLNNTNAVYATYNGLQAIDIIYGLISIGISIWALTIYVHMKKFRTKAPQYTNIYLIIRTAITAIYSIAFIGITGVADSFSSDLVSVVVWISMIIYNKKYFAERESFFVN